MKRFLVIVPIATISFALTVFALSSFLPTDIVLAQESGKDPSKASTFATRVAEILGIDSSKVEDAIKQARSELRDEAVQKRLDMMVENGRLTQEQADEYLAWIKSRPEGLRPMGRPGFGKKDHRKHRRGFGRFDKSRRQFSTGARTTSLEDIQKKLSALVEEGKLTKEDAAEKLEWFQARRAKD